jgi:hypothetical protein
MTPDLDIYRAANVIKKQHGEDAPIHAAMPADAMLETTTTLSVVFLAASLGHTQAGEISYLFPSTSESLKLALVRIEIQRHECPSRVNFPRRTGLPTKSGPGGNPEGIRAIPDIGAWKSGIRGKLTVGQNGPGR